MPSLEQFIATRRHEWAQLEALLARSEGNGLRHLRPAELDQLGGGYRRLVSDLAIAQRDFPEDQLTSALNALAARAHLRLYRAPSGSWRRLARFFTVDFARQLRQAGPYLLGAAALLFGPLVWAYVAAARSAAVRAALVPPALAGVMARGRTWTDMAPAIRPAMAALIFTNNIQVTFAAFAGGALFGLGTAYALAMNGLMIGAVLGAAQHYGVAPLLWAFISPHGYLELSMIVVSGASGLMLGDAVLRPGLLRRRDALTLAGRRALALTLGAAPVLVVAGLIEGLISPSSLPPAARIAIGPLVWLAWLAAMVALGQPACRRAA